MKLREPGAQLALNQRITFFTLIYLALATPQACGEARDKSPGPPIDWDAMFVNGVTSNVAEVKREMGFDLLVPSLLGNPARIVITSPEASPPSFRLAGFVYEDPKHGTYGDRSGESDHAEGARVPDRVRGGAACEGSWIIVGLPRGIRGVLVEGPIATNVLWLEGERRFDVIGPSEEFDGSFATEVASNVVLSEPVSAT